MTPELQDAFTRLSKNSDFKLCFAYLVTQAADNLLATTPTDTDALRAGAITYNALQAASMSITEYAQTSADNAMKG